MLEKDRAIYKRLGERELIYKNRLLDTARSNADASLNAYQSGVTEFTTVMRARITELDVRLDDLRVRIDRARATARLLYITGEPK
jgi:outer membrane protein TolC